MNYIELVALLRENAEEDFAVFQERLIKTKYTILGVRTPKLRKTAKLFAGAIKELLEFPDEYYEVVFIKLAAVAALPYWELTLYLEKAVSLMDNWALCDSFRPKSVLKQRDEFLPIVLSFLEKLGEFEKRFAIVCLLVYYTEEKYLSVIENVLQTIDTKEYFVHMAVAWLVAEILIKHYDYGVSLLKKGLLKPKTHNKAIQKACESYRLTKEEKIKLNHLKIKITER